MKIIFISRPTYFTPMRERLFLKNEIDKYEIEYWSTYYLYNKVNPYSYLQLDNQEKIKTIIFKREKDLLKKVFEMNKKDIVIISEEIDYINYKFFKELYKKNIKIIFFFPENIPDIRSNEKKVKKIILYLKKPKIFFQKLYIKLKKQFYKYKILKLKEKMEDAIFLISGKKKEEEIKKQFNNKKNKFIPIMSRDLIKYREANYSLEDNIVFIDQYLPYHPDFKLRKTKSVEPISYYKYLNDFFTKIEKKYNMEIVIAAHPSSNYEFNPFNNRKIVKFKTTEEIKKSKFIIGHYSTSLGLVTIEKKPLIIINMDIFSDSIKDCIETFSKELGVIPVNLSSNNTKIDFEKNDIFYENYYKNYLYQGKSESIPIIEILKIINNIREGKNV